jgi:hypothetical protein
VCGPHRHPCDDDGPHTGAETARRVRLPPAPWLIRTTRPACGRKCMARNSLQVLEPTTPRSASCWPRCEVADVADGRAASTHRSTHRRQAEDHRPADAWDSIVGTPGTGRRRQRRLWGLGASFFGDPGVDGRPGADGRPTRHDLVQVDVRGPILGAEEALTAPLTRAVSTHLAGIGQLKSQ